MLEDQQKNKDHHSVPAGLPFQRCTVDDPNNSHAAIYKARRKQL